MEELILNPNKRNREIQTIATNFYQFVANQLYIVFYNVAKKIVENGELKAEDIYKVKIFSEKKIIFRNINGLSLVASVIMIQRKRLKN